MVFWFIIPTEIIARAKPLESIKKLTILKKSQLQEMSA